MGPIVEEVNVIWYPGRAIIKLLNVIDHLYKMVEYSSVSNSSGVQ